MAVTIDGAGPLAGATTLNGLTIPTTGFGKVLQVVRATDSTARSSTSSTYVDSNLNVTITPQKSTSAIILIYTVYFSAGGTSINRWAGFQITDSSNVALSGASQTFSGIDGFSNWSAGLFLNGATVIGYDLPASASAKTYKVRYRTSDGITTVTLRNNSQAAQLYAIEVDS